MLPRRKMFYPAGFISLSLFFFLGITTISKRLPIRFNCIEVSYPDSGTFHIFNFNPIVFPKENFTRIELTGENEDNTKLVNAQALIKELMNQEDSTKGLEFMFHHGAKYSSLVRLFDLCNIEGARTYLNYGDKFWVFGLRIRSNARLVPSFFCGTPSMTQHRDSSAHPAEVWALTPSFLISTVMGLVWLAILSGRQIAAISRSGNRPSPA